MSTAYPCIGVPIIRTVRLYCGVWARYCNTNASRGSAVEGAGLTKVPDKRDPTGVPESKTTKETKVKLPHKVESIVKVCIAVQCRRKETRSPSTLLNAIAHPTWFWSIIWPNVLVWHAIPWCVLCRLIGCLANGKVISLPEVGHCIIACSTRKTYFQLYYQ